MPKTKTQAVKADRYALPARKPTEFAIEGDLWIRYTSGGPLFVIDDCHLSEFVRRHFGSRETEEGYRIGQVKILIVPVKE